LAAETYALTASQGSDNSTGDLDFEAAADRLLLVEGNGALIQSDGLAENNTRGRIMSFHPPTGEGTIDLIEIRDVTLARGWLTGDNGGAISVDTGLAGPADGYSGEIDVTFTRVTV